MERMLLCPQLRQKCTALHGQFFGQNGALLGKRLIILRYRIGAECNVTGRLCQLPGIDCKIAIGQSGIQLGQNRLQRCLIQFGKDVFGTHFFQLIADLQARGQFQRLGKLDAKAGKETKIIAAFPALVSHCRKLLCTVQRGIQRQQVLLVLGQRATATQHAPGIGAANTAGQDGPDKGILGIRIQQGIGVQTHHDLGYSVGKILLHMGLDQRTPPVNKLLCPLRLPL